MDLTPTQFLHCSKGRDFGEVAQGCADACKVPAGPIRLQHGYEGTKGFGNRHVEAYDGRIRQLNGLGYKSFTAFAEDVAQNYDRAEANEPGKHGQPRLRLVWRTRSYDFVLVVQFDKAGGFWTIVTGVPMREHDRDVLHRESRTSGCEPPPPSVVKKSRFATLSLPKKTTGDGNGS